MWGSIASAAKGLAESDTGKYLINPAAKSLQDMGSFAMGNSPSSGESAKIDWGKLTEASKANQPALTNPTPTKSPTANGGFSPQDAATLPSDERLKEVFGDDDRIADLARVNSYDFTYKPEAQDAKGLDGEEHTGVMYQELKDNPAFKGCTSEDEQGYGQLNIKELTAANTAGLSDVAREIMDLRARMARLEDNIGR